MMTADDHAEHEKLQEDKLLLVAVLEKSDELSAKERRAFIDMLNRTRSLTTKQRQWLDDVAERLGVVDYTGARNVFSELSPEKQREHKERATKVKLPWEREGHQKPLKPPGRQ